MDSKSLQMQVMVITFMALIVVATGAQDANCPPLTSYAPCFSFIHNDNKAPGFDDPCCALIRTTPESCLCDTAKNNDNLGIDLEKALTLPKTCGRKVPAKTYCGNLRVPS